MISIKEFLGLKVYISELDQFLTHFDREHPKLSASQLKEVEKFARIYKLRDNPTESEKPASIWDAF